MRTFSRRARGALAIAIAAVLGPSTVNPTHAMADSAATNRPSPGVATGELLYREGRFQAAFDSFAAAFLARPSPEVLRWMGRCQAGLRSWDAAVFFYRGYLDGTPDAADRAEVERLIAEAEATKAAESVAPVAGPSTPIHRRWWLWTTLGLAVAGGGTAAAILLWPRPLPTDTLGTIDAR